MEREWYDMWEMATALKMWYLVMVDHATPKRNHAVRNPTVVLASRRTDLATVMTADRMEISSWAIEMAGRGSQSAVVGPY